uniref:Tetratricopeptide (TPR) repeat n=1 Tax=Candidatus Kentrum sp. FW TaxID=2126338 RepID=A0A450TI23_9GAMM|nr:MAG: Tetratricopeptide (TPR) repeat [Candidatus Kentron sp. FW]
MSGIVQDIKDHLEPYRWLSPRSDKEDFRVGIDSVGTAHEKATQLFSEDKPDMAIQVAKHVLEKKISGSPDDFHNLAAQLARKDLYSRASQIILLGLESFDKNIDLLSDGVKYLSSSGDTERANELAKRLQDIPKDHWNWRAFVFLGDYFELMGEFEKAFAVYEEFKKQRPYDERAYSQHGGVFQQWGKYDEAIQIFEEGLRKVRKAPQTALRLADCYIEVGEYSKAIAAIDRAIEGTADSQPSVNISSLFWTRAEAEDALVHSGTITDTKELGKYIESAITDYQAALSMPDCIIVYRIHGPQRIKVLRLYADNHGIDVQTGGRDDEQGAGLSGLPPELLGRLIEMQDHEDDESEEGEEGLES